MEDVLAVYEKPLSAREPVVCIDEKPVLLHQEVRPPVALQPGRVARRDAEYRRCGTANVFCGVQPKAGRHFTAWANAALGIELPCGRKLGRGTVAPIATVSPSSGALLASRLVTSLATKLYGHGTRTTNPMPQSWRSRQSSAWIFCAIRSVAISGCRSVTSVSTAKQTPAKPQLSQSSRATPPTAYWQGDV
jgi:hypothetical protein